MQLKDLINLKVKLFILFTKFIDPQLNYKDLMKYSYKNTNFSKLFMQNIFGS